MRWSTSSRAHRLLILGAIAAGFLLPAAGCGGSGGSGTVVPTTVEHGKKNKEMQEFMKTQQAK